jgi:hypothetical protein
VPPFYAVALWILGTYFVEVWASWPKLPMSSPEKRCGKTVLAETIEAHVNRAFLVNNISAAGLFRIIEECHLTLINDEADPGIDMQGFDMSSTEQIARLKAEAQAGVANADVVYISDVPVVLRELLEAGIIEN